MSFPLSPGGCFTGRSYLYLMGRGLQSRNEIISIGWASLQKGPHLHVEGQHIRPDKNFPKSYTNYCN